ncbi:MAG: ABC transporter permease [Bacteroidales bacterium]|nr:ABC transporter permease [Bacteroidales bacterium]
MIGNFIKLAIRHMIRQRSYIFINIVGLAVGLACSILIGLFVLDEFSYDKFNEKKDRIYRCYIKGKMGETEIEGAWTCTPLGPTLVTDLPEVLDAVRINDWSETVIKYKDKSFIEDGFKQADSTFFNIFSIPLIQGDPKTALAAPHTLVMTETTARKIFGNEDPIGKMIRVGTDTTYYSVTGIVADVPDNSHFDFNILGSFITNPRANDGIWFSNSFYTYILLAENTSAERLQEKMPAVVNKYIEPQLEQFLGISLEEFLLGGNSYGYFIQPLLDIHLNQDIDHGLKPSHNKRYIYIFSLIAVLILVIAGINYMNLATARSAGRSKEVGIRKVVGSSRGLIVWQFLFESVFLTMVSLIFAVLIVELILPGFNNLLQIQVSLNYLENWYIIPGLLALGFLLAIMAGSYPAFFLSSFRPVAVLTGSLKAGTKSKLLRSILVVFQMAASVLIILGTLIVYRQINYMINKDLGFNKEQLLVIRRVDALGNQKETFLDEVRKLTGVKQASHSTAVPGHPNNNNGYWVEGQNAEKSYLMQTNWIDDYHPGTYELNIADGRFFSEDYASDSAACIINESAVRQFGFEDPFKVRFMQPADNQATRWNYLQVIGVVKDFHYQSLHDRIYPHIFILKPESFNWGYITIRLMPGNINQTVKQVEKFWLDFSDNDPMVSFFLDEDFEELYSEDKRTGSLALVFSILAILIASLGLFGLTSFTIEQRTKEIGIRKVNGASGRTIILLLLKEIVLLVVIATLIAWAAAYIFMKGWLQNFYFRISLSPVDFLFSLLIVLAITWLTISYRSFKAAKTNPAQALKYE